MTTLPIWTRLIKGGGQIDGFEGSIGTVGGDPEEAGRRQELQEKLETLRMRVRVAPEGVRDAEIIEAIRPQFELISGDEFLDESAWLMDALSFTHSSYSPR